MLKIDNKDREILFHLSLNARASLTELAKKTKLSKEVVHYRLKNLEKEGVVEGYYAVINTYKMGKEFYRVYLKTINMTTDVEKQFISYLKKHPKVTWIVEVDGDLDFLYVVWAKNISEFEEVYNEINDKFGKYTEQKFFSVMTNVYYFKDKYLVEREDGTYKLTGGKIEYPDLDDLDLKLITLLSNEGRLPLIDIGRKLNVPAKTIQRRMKRLMSEGIITCYNVKINHKALGYTQRKVMLNLNDTSKQAMKKLISFITYHKYTIYITIAIGQYDLEFETMEKSHDEFHSLLKELKNTFPDLIKNYFTVVFYNEPKVGQLELY
ncbi:MAG: Lrp/AsnC family transcriptional regulator [Nanoarchaeota archaeon]